MPTGAKLIAGVFFALFGWFIADLVKPYLPEAQPAAWFNEVMAAVGFVMGWQMSGKNAGRGLRPGIGYGLTTIGLMAFWGVLIFAFSEMLSNSLDNRYRGPMHALKSMVGIMIADLKYVIKPDVFITGIVGGCVGGWITEWTAKRWM